MADVTFKEVNSNDPIEYVFQDKKGAMYSLYTDSRATDVQGLTPDFWDKFYFCKRIVVDYHLVENKNYITKIISYK